LIGRVSKSALFSSSSTTEVASVTADLDTRGAELYASGEQTLPVRQSGSDPAAAGDFVASREQFECLVRFLDGGDAARLSHGELEDRLDREGRELLRVLLDEHLALRAAREPRLDEVRGADAVLRGRVEAGHARSLQTVFGTVSVARLAYRAAGRRNLYVADAQLNLPVERQSHGLRRLAALEATRGSFDDALGAIERQTGQRLGKRQVQELAQLASIDFDGFYARRRPAPAQLSDVLVLSADGKGVVVRPDALRSATRKAKAAEQARAGPAPAGRLRSGQTPYRKRMAEIGAVYDATPAPRTAPDILAHEDHQPAAPGPVATNKWLTASITKDPATVIAQVFDQADRRDPEHRRTWVALVDGAQHQLSAIRVQARRRKVNVAIIVDFVHVLEYLWKASACLFEDGSAEAQRWVHRQANRVLEGRARQVAKTIRHSASTHQITTPRNNAEQAATYLTNHARYLDYRTALANGWPIATGIVEGGCRHLVKDRMDLTGARWGLTSAEAILKLRAITTNGDFDEYWQYHLQQERQLVHHARYQDHTVPLPAT
jgi:hypothetical protein